MPNLTEVKKRALFKALATKSQFAVGKEFGLDKEYDKPIRVVNAVRAIYNEVCEDPEKFGISTEIVEMVNKGMVERRTKRNSFSLNSEPFAGGVGQDAEKALISRVKSKAWQLIDKKLDHIASSPAAFHKESLMSLMKAGGIAFDKAQIDSGLATEHIAVIAKVMPNMSSEEALAALTKMSEAQASDD